MPKNPTPRKSPPRKSAPRKSAPRKSAPRKPPKPSLKRRLLRWVYKTVFNLSLIALAALAVWLWTLNQTVLRGFQLPREQLPTHLYSRPFQLSKGDTLPSDALIQALQTRGFSRVKQLNAPKQYAYHPPYLDIFTPSAVPWGNDKPQAVRLLFADGKLKSLTHHSSGAAVNSLALAPMLLGNLASGPVEDRLEISLHEAPKLLLDAVLTMEDRRFMTHPGVDLFGVLRALLSTITPGGRRQGGSTLTQQLVKNIYLNPSRNLSRKFKEAIMSLLVEHHFSKSQILERYLNTLFLGQSGNRAIHGFALASQYYFGSDLSTISPGQLAMLVGMIAAPSAYNPLRYPERAIKRRNLVLSALAQNGFISAAKSQQYQAQALALNHPQAGQPSAMHSRYPAFVDLLKQQLAQTFAAGLTTSTGLDLYTTLDAAMQQQAAAAFKHALAALEKKHHLATGFLQGAMLIIKPKTGEILAIIGSKDNQAAGFNRALYAKRPVGSLLKPAVYLTALQNPKRYSLATRISDAPISIPLDNGTTWRPQNYDNKHHGSPTLYQSLAHSYNIPAVKIGTEVGVKAVLTTMQRLGITTELPAYPSLILGAANLSVFEMAQMYQVLANQGRLQPLKTLRVVANRAAEPLTQHLTAGEQTINPAAVYLLNTALQEVLKSGTGKALQTLLPNVNLAGKTGTTNDYRDSWFAGFGSNYLGVVWVGNDANKPTGLTGASGALRVWAAVMQATNLQSLNTPPPSSIKWLAIDKDNGGEAVAGCTNNSVSRAFIAGYAPPENAHCGRTTTANWFTQWFSKPPATQPPATQSAPIKSANKKPESNR